MSKVTTLITGTYLIMFELGNNDSRFSVVAGHTKLDLTKKKNLTGKYSNQQNLRIKKHKIEKGSRARHLAIEEYQPHSIAQKPINSTSKRIGVFNCAGPYVRNNQLVLNRQYVSQSETASTIPVKQVKHV